MSSDDQIRPYHATTGSETADSLAEVLEHAAAREEAAHKRTGPKKSPKWMLPLGINLGVFAVYLLIAPPDWVVMDPLEGPPPAEQSRSMRVAMYFQSQRIEAYRLENGRLPDALADAGTPVPGVEYNKRGADRYELVADAGGEVLLYDSSAPAAEFEEAVANRLGGA